MLNPNEIKAVHAQQRAAIHSRFAELESPSTDISKSEGAAPAYWTEEGLSRFKDDLFKGIDGGTITDEQLEKAQDELLCLSKSKMSIDGVDTEVYIKG